MQWSCFCPLWSYAVLRMGGWEWVRGKERHVVSCLQVNRSEYINDCGAISCPFKVVRGGGGDKVSCTGGSGQFSMFSGGRGTDRATGPLFGSSWNATEALYRPTNKPKETNNKKALFFSPWKALMGVVQSISLYMLMLQWYFIHPRGDIKMLQTLN